MYLQFETKVPDGHEVGIPLLHDAHNIRSDTPVTGIKVDGLEVNVEDRTIETFVHTVSRINTETLQPEHFRDCNHFAMAMCGQWMPTHPILERGFSMKVECEDNTGAEEYYGPTALGIANDGRCLNFGSENYVYTHTVFAINSSLGALCFAKLGVSNEYSLSTFDTALAGNKLEVAHPIKKLSVTKATKVIFRWCDSGML